MADFVMTIEGNDAPVDTPGTLARPKDAGRGVYTAAQQHDPVSDSGAESASDGDEGASVNSGGFSGGFSFNPDSGSDDGESSAGEGGDKDDWYENAETSSWDFTGAIKKLEKEAASRGGASTSVDEKIRQLLHKRNAITKKPKGSDGSSAGSSNGDSSESGGDSANGSAGGSADGSDDGSDDGSAAAPRGSSDDSSAAAPRGSSKEENAGAEVPPCGP